MQTTTSMSLPWVCVATPYGAPASARDLDMITSVLGSMLDTDCLIGLDVLDVLDERMLILVGIDHLMSNAKSALPRRTCNKFIYQQANQEAI